METGTENGARIEKQSTQGDISIQITAYLTTEVGRVVLQGSGSFADPGWDAAAGGAGWPGARRRGAEGGREGDGGQFDGAVVSTGAECTGLNGGGKRNQGHNG